MLLAASGKTALSFAQQLRHTREPGSGPLKIVGITSSAATAFVQGTGFYTAVLSYDDLQQPQKVLSAISSTAPQSPKRILLCDFGARGTVTEDVHRLLQQGAEVPITTLGIGFEARAYTPEELSEMGARAARLGLVQLNSSGLRSRAMEILGEETYFADLSARWSEFKEGGGVPGLNTRWGQGMVGEDGVEGVWNRLCSKGDNITPASKPQEGFVVKL